MLANYTHTSLKIKADILISSSLIGQISVEEEEWSNWESETSKSAVHLKYKITEFKDESLLFNSGDSDNRHSILSQAPGRIVFLEKLFSGSQL